MRAPAPALACALAAALVGCTGASQQGAPASSATRNPADALKDALLLSSVKATLVADDPDSTTSVGVAAVAGIVTLRGTVKDGATRARLVADARKVGGVKRVVDDLRVDPNAPQFRQQVGDVALAARVQAAIAAEVGLQHVGVRVDRGVATLDGSVPDAKTRATVVRTARDTAGIRNVVDRIRVAGP